MASGSWTALDLTRCLCEPLVYSRLGASIQCVVAARSHTHLSQRPCQINILCLSCVFVHRHALPPSPSCPHEYMHSHGISVAISATLKLSSAVSHPATLLCEACHRVHQPIADAHVAMSAGLVHRPCVTAMTMAHQLFPSPDDHQLRCIL